jgi:hypothetical protein
MKELVAKYIDQCITVGILTPEKIRKYPLKEGNIGVVLKAYALHSRLPFALDNSDVSIYQGYNLYLTKDGYKWLINEFKSFTLAYLRSAFQHVFINLNDIKSIDKYEGLNNFKGLSGINYKVGTLNGAILVREQGVRKHELYFTTLAEARKEVLNLSRFYPIENFTLYRTGEIKGVYYKQKVPLILESNRRGVPVNLPHLKG